MKYTIERYSADGHGVPEHPVIGEAGNITEARAIVRQAMGLSRLSPARRWRPGVAESGRYSPEAYHDLLEHEAGSHGCGGIAIVEAA